MLNPAQQIAQELQVKETQVSAALQLLDEGATVPFIARYRKEATGGLDDTQLRLLEERLHYLRDLEKRREAILQSIEEQGKLTPELKSALESADTKARLEDLYLPYKPKRRTKAQIAREAGLDPLAQSLLRNPNQNPSQTAQPFINPEAGFADTESTLEGAQQILIEDFAEDPELNGQLRQWLWNQGVVISTVVKGKNEEGAKFSDYFNYHEPIKAIPSHRALALFRGKSEGFLRVALKPGADSQAITQATEMLESRIAKHFGIRLQNRPADDWLMNAVHQTWSDKILPRMETDLLSQLRENAEEEAIQVFARNLRALLLAAPAGPRITLALDPGFRTGVKLAVVDGTGKVLDTGVIYPHVPTNAWQQSLDTLTALIKKHQVALISIGNGTASRETDKLAVELIKAHPELKVSKAMVSEAGASVYSASALAAKEMPNLDVSLAARAEAE